MSQSAAGLAASRALRRAYWFYCAYRVEKALLALCDAVERKYNPNQPRVPAGNPDGGQWTDAGGGGGRSPRMHPRLPRSALAALGFSDDEPDERVRVAQGRSGRRGGGLSGYITLCNGAQKPATLRQEAEVLALRLRANKLTRQIRERQPSWRGTDHLVETVRGEIGALRAEVREAEVHLQGLRLREVGLGPNARQSIPARGPERRFSGSERREINRMGREDGCHRCATKDPGTRRGNFIPDHQPPNALRRPGESQRLFPQCKRCSDKQGGHLRHLKK